MHYPNPSIQETFITFILKCMERDYRKVSCTHREKYGQGQNKKEVPHRKGEGKGRYHEVMHSILTQLN